MSKTQKQLLGKKGEEIAKKFLIKKGYSVLEENFRYGRGEIDLICRDGNDIVIVEVKSVRVQGFGEGEERIPLKKQKKIIQTTYGYLGFHPQWNGFGVRFDVVVINFYCEPVEIIHYEGAFYQQR